jgi:hypothetical protein
MRNYDFGFIKDRVGELPADYEAVKTGLIEELRQLRDTDFIQALNRLCALLNKPAFDNGWQRRHVYFLLHDLLNHHAQLFPNFDQLLLDAETAIIGDCAAAAITSFPGEPEEEEELAAYVRGFDWL